MMHGPDLPTEISQHNERQQIFIVAAPYALTKDDIATILNHEDDHELRINYHNLLTTSFRPVAALLHNDANIVVRALLCTQTKGFVSPKHNAEYKLHLGLEGTETVFDQKVLFD